VFLGLTLISIRKIIKYLFSKGWMSYKLSPSSLSLMKECPRCFWLEQNKIWKRPSGIFPSLPSGMDRILKKHFDSFRDKGVLPPELVNAFDEVEASNFNLFGESDEEKDLLEVWRDSRKGLRYQDSEGNILAGAVDNLLVRNGKLIVLDYKTRGYDLKKDTHEHYQDQLDVYSLLLERNGYDLEGYAFLLFYIPERVLESGEFIFDTKLIKMPISPENAEDLFMKALEILNGECPEKRECGWCSGFTWDES